jgi:hypothetical protein
MKLLEQELATYLNMGMRFLTANDLQKLESPGLKTLSDAEQAEALTKEIPKRVLAETSVPEFAPKIEEPAASLEDLSTLSALPAPSASVSADAEQVQEEQGQAPLSPIEEEIELQEINGSEIPVQPGPPQQLGPAAPYLVIPMNNAQAQAFPQVQGQPQQNAIVASLAPPPPASVLPGPLPGAPPMIAVDTSVAALQAQGLPAINQQPNRSAPIRSAPIRSAPIRSAPIRSALRNNNGTQKAKRVAFGSAEQQQAGPPAPNMRVNVIKQGS